MAIHVKLALELSEALAECLGWFEACRKLGFAAEEIYLVIYTNGLGMELHTQGRRVPLVLVDVRRMQPQEIIQGMWTALSTRWNGTGMTDGERREIYALTAAGLHFRGEALGATQAPAHG